MSLIKRIVIYPVTDLGSSVLTRGGRPRGNIADRGHVTWAGPHIFPCVYAGPDPMGTRLKMTGA